MKRVLPTVALLLPACLGTTGSRIVSFHVDAAGPADAVDGQPLGFDTGRGWHVELTKATLHIGAVYLDESLPVSGAQDTSCILEGVYAGQETSALDMNVLSPAPQPFGSPGNGTADRAITGEVWLTGGDVNAADDSTTIVDVEGAASRAGSRYPFTASVTIGSNRAVASTNPALPGANPICKQRIVAPIPVDLVPTDGGTLLVRVDPRGWFGDVDFSQMQQTASNPAAYVIPDDDTTQAGSALFDGVHASTGVYSFGWQP